MKSFADIVREVVRGIPEGEFRTYKQVAVAAGSPSAARAVGNIMRTNADKTVPCHRVIRSDGKIGAYNGLRGDDKREILQKEGAL